MDFDTFMIMPKELNYLDKSLVLFGIFRFIFWCLLAICYPIDLYYRRKYKVRRYIY